MGVIIPRIELGILGGVFDPPHLGHVALARAAIANLGLERLLVLVNEDPGHKRAIAPVEARLELARLAFEELPQVEVGLDGHPRTVDMLEELRPKNAAFVVGADELADFGTWKEPARVLELVRLGVAMRPGVPAGRLLEARARVPAPERVSSFDMEPVAVSSSDVRERIARGEPIDDLVPRRVAEAIARLHLYRGPE